MQLILLRAEEAIALPTAKKAFVCADLGSEEAREHAGLPQPSVESQMPPIGEL